MKKRGILVPERDVLDKLPRKEGRRTWREVLRDVWLAFRGKTFVTMRGYCFRCGSGFHIEAYQDCRFPLRPKCRCEDPVSLDMMRFNATSYWPTQLMKTAPSFVLEAKTGDHLTYEEAEELERRVGYGSEWWEEDTVEAIKNRGAVRAEHQAFENDS